MKVAALAGTPQHARKQVEAGVDIIVAQGTEAGGHTGEISTMVLVPEVVDAVGPVPVLAAGGIGNGRQMAAGAGARRRGRVDRLDLAHRRGGRHARRWSSERILAATSRDTVRSRSLTGKPARLLRTAWTEAWESAESPGTLPMPLQFMLISDALRRIGRSGAAELATFPAGQIIGAMNQVRSARDVVSGWPRSSWRPRSGLGRLTGDSSRAAPGRTQSHGICTKTCGEPFQKPR